MHVVRVVLSFSSTGSINLYGGKQYGSAGNWFQSRLIASVFTAWRSGHGLTYVRSLALNFVANRSIDGIPL
jgi:hypothetical protein